MKKEIQELIKISNFYGKTTDYVIAGGGNTSYKDDKLIYIKASGTILHEINEKGFAVLDRKKVRKILSTKYSHDPIKREDQIKRDLLNSRIDREKGARPSVETSPHEIIEYKYVVHTHPYMINSLLCSKNVLSLVKKFFKDDVLYIPYTTPGFTLAKKIESELIKYRKKFNSEPHIILLQNHGIFISASTTDEVKKLYNSVTQKITCNYRNKIRIKDLPVDKNIMKILPAMRMLLSRNSIKVLKLRNNTLIASFCRNKESAARVALPFMPDDIVYSKVSPLYIDDTSTPERLIKSFKSELARYKKKWGYIPKVILLKGIGMIGVEESIKSVEIILDTFEGVMKTSHYSANFGGHNFMTKKDIEFIDNWEVESYRRKIAKMAAKIGKVNNMIAIVTGGAQGFGQGIAEDLFKEGANVVIADINEKKGKKLEEDFNIQNRNNSALFVKTDVTDASSIKNMLLKTVKEFGGLDILISNAGVLQAGSLDEIEDDVFSFVTNVNYKGYFLCTKYSSKIMKLQNKYKSDYFTDIIQINSKSGLKGSNKNFAYAGGKFGGIGLTQSFALELVEHKIKVNSICPGNFFEGPLWSDPKTGLLVQYLKAGKVMGARTIKDVKEHYENMVPLKRGCLVEDVMKTVYYIIDQNYETGQAIPVTGGQIMLK